jgi:hypothetical protein
MLIRKIQKKKKKSNLQKRKEVEGPSLRPIKIFAYK